MKGKMSYILLCALLPFAALLFLSGARAAAQEASLVGQELNNFSLSSAQDRLVNYGRDYYGKSNLIITFFPAAFTPV